MAIDRLLRANRTVLFVPVVDIAGVPTLVSSTGVLAPFSAPTAAVLESWRGITTTATAAAAHGGNPSGAILDDMDLGLAASDTDTQLVITSLGNEVAPTFKNVDASFTALRDKSKADAGVYNFATRLFLGPDFRFAAVDRIGYTPGSAFVTGQVVSLFEMSTDFPTDVKADRGNLAIKQAPAPSGLVLPNYTLAA